MIKMEKFHLENLKMEHLTYMKIHSCLFDAIKKNKIKFFH